MTHDEIMAMAREADPFGDDGRLVSLAMLTPGTLERFAALVAAAEREACANVCESEWATDAERAFGGELAALIRARGTP